MAQESQSLDATTSTSQKAEINSMYGKSGSDNPGQTDNNNPFVVIEGRVNAGIARAMGIARTTVYRIIRHYVSGNHPYCTADTSDVSGYGIIECDILSAYPQQSSEEKQEKEQE